MVQVSKSEDLRKWAQRYGNLCDASATESSFKLDETEKHISATCRVLNSSTVHDDISLQDVLTVVKFMDSEEQYNREKRSRDHLQDSASTIRGHEAHLRPVDDCVVQLYHAFEVDRDSKEWRTLVKLNPRLQSYGKYVLVMPRGRRDLMDVLAHDRIAGHDKAKALHYGQEIATCLFAMERARYVHGDIKLLNLMVFEDQEETSQQKKEVIKAIDLDAAVRYGSIVGVKLSSAVVPPEIARLVWRYQQEAEKPPWDDWTSWEEWLTQQSDRCFASAQFDIWSFGVALYRLCVADGVSLFLSSQADNIVEPEDLRRLAFEWDRVKLEKLSKVRLTSTFSLATHFLIQI